MNDFKDRIVSRLGRRGSIAAGILVAFAFVSVGGPLVLAGTTASIAAFGITALVLIGPAVWVLADARKRGVERPFLWALFALFGNVIGALVYFLVRDERPKTRPCTTCGGQVNSVHSACPFCGASQAPSKRSCGSCHNELELGWRFCPYCRTEVGAVNTAT